MLIYQGDGGRVEKGFFTGVKLYPAGSSQKVTPTRWMKHQMGALHVALKSYGLDAINDAHVAGAFWDYFLELASSPPDGLYHRAAADEPLIDVVERIANEATQSRLK